MLARANLAVITGKGVQISNMTSAAGKPIAQKKTPEANKEFAFIISRTDFELLPMLTILPKTFIKIINAANLFFRGVLDYFRLTSCRY